MTASTVHDKFCQIWISQSWCHLWAQLEVQPHKPIAAQAAPKTPREWEVSLILLW